MYHQLLDLPFLDGDLSYGSDFKLRYWQYLYPAESLSDQDAFITEGCLVMISGGASGITEGSGDPWSADDKISVRKAVCHARLKDNHLEKVRSVTQTIVDAAFDHGYLSTDHPSYDEVADARYWLHENCVQAYFKAAVAGFTQYLVRPKA